MCLLSLPYPTTFIKELLLVVETVNCFGSGVVGLSFLTHTHTPPRLTSQWKKKPCDHSRRRYHSLHDVAVTHALPFSRPPVGCFSSADLWMGGCILSSQAGFGLLRSSFPVNIVVFSMIEVWCELSSMHRLRVCISPPQCGQCKFFHAFSCPGRTVDFPML